MPNLHPEQVQKIDEYIHNQQLIHAIKYYREITGVGLAEAKQAIEEIGSDDFSKPSSVVQGSADPIMDNKIRSLLARRQKIEAVKIYREEHGIGLKEAKDYVDQIEYSMLRENPSHGLPYESAIRGDPFADDESSRRRMIILAVGILVLLCGAGVFFSMLNF